MLILLITVLIDYWLKRSSITSQRSVTSACNPASVKQGKIARDLSWNKRITNRNDKASRHFNPCPCFPRSHCFAGDYRVYSWHFCIAREENNDTVVIRASIKKKVQWVTRSPGHVTGWLQSTEPIPCVYRLIEDNYAVHLLFASRWGS